MDKQLPENSAMRTIAQGSLSRQLGLTRKQSIELERKVYETCTRRKYPLVIRRLLSGQAFEAAIIDKEIQREKKQKIIVAEGDITCPKCKSRRVSRVEKQTRSADESATVFCHCSECDHRFKF